MKHRKIKIGIAGLGKIGSAVISELYKQREDFEKETGIELVVKKTADEDGERRIYQLPFTKDTEELLNSDIDIFVELIGGYNPAFEYIKTALLKGKHVVTANKVVIDKYGPELEKIALDNRIYLRFSASVGGGIGIIDKILTSEGNNTKTIMGILNGTTNYILTRMTEGLDYPSALQEAQQKGFAEANPEFDLSGKDAAQKLAILTSINFKSRVSSDEIYCEGVKDVSIEDINFAKQLGYTIKLLGISRLEGDSLETRVQPVMLSERHVLASVNYETNAIYLKGNANIMLAGEGAGKPTAGSIMSDIRQIARLTRNPYQKISFFGSRQLEIVKKEDLESEFYLKFYGLDKPGTLHSLTGTLAQNDINISKAIQVGEHKENFVPIIITVCKTKYGQIKKAIENVDKGKLQFGSIFMISNSR